MANQYVMAFDLGTSSIKVAIVDAEANIVGVGFDAPSAGWIPVTKEKGALYPSMI